MQLGLSFTVLLASLILALSSVQEAEAAPTRRNVGLITLPLKRVHKERSDVHPQILLQQRMNRAHKRLARMTGREPPSTRELEANLAKRMFIPPGGRKGTPVTKRFNRQGAGAPVALADEQVNSLAAEKGGLAGLLGALTGGGKKAKAAKGAAAGAAAGAAGGAAAAQGAGTAGQAAGTGAAGENGTAAAGTGGQAAGTGAAAGNGTGAAAANDDNGQPFSKVALQGLENGGLTKATGTLANNSLGLNIEGDDTGYIATVQMGTPPQNFNLLMDSGSADLWVGSENCASESGGGCGNHQFLGTKSSSSFKATKEQFQVTYGTGNVKGVKITDNIAIAGLQLNAHPFGVANEESVDFSSDAVPFDGLMGLAQSTLSEQQNLTPVESLAKAGLIQDAITSYKISRLQDQKNDGEITFGGIDSSKIQQNTLVTFANVNQNGFWEGDMAAVTVDGQDTNLQNRTAILDTGTTLIVAPPADALAVHQLITGAKSDGQGGFTVPCTTNATVALSFGGRSFAINPVDLKAQPVSNDLSGDCVSGISSGQIGGATEWLVGDVFLKNAYFSTDVGKNQISLAELA